MSKSLSYFLVLFFITTNLFAQLPHPDAKKENLGPKINTEFEEKVPIITPDGGVLFFSRFEFNSQSIGELGKKIYGNVTYYSELQPDGSWGIAKKLDALNYRHNQWICSITKNGDTIMFRGWNNGHPALNFMNKLGKRWSAPEEIEIIDYNNRSWYHAFSLTSSSKEILMSIEDGPNCDTNDIFVSFLQKDGLWSKPLNLGPDINTDGREMSSFMDLDGITLYFASEGHDSYGGLDIFMSKRLDSTWQHWSTPVNLGPNVNTNGDDNYWHISPKRDYAYFCSKRLGIRESMSDSDNYGKYDIYRISLHEKIKPVFHLSGKVVEKETEQPVRSRIIVEALPEMSLVTTIAVQDTSGEYSLELPFAKMYGLRAEAEGYYGINRTLDLTENTSTDLLMDFYLVKPKINLPIRLNNIFFETGKHEVLPASYSELDRLVTLLKENVKIYIQVSGHTDNIGSDESNMILSNERAKAVADYLTNHGIDSTRVIYKGYGRTVPVAENDSEDGRQMNRRVEFTILKN